jgi:hypothetical protein
MLDERKNSLSNTKIIELKAYCTMLNPNKARLKRLLRITCNVNDHFERILNDFS